MYNLVDELLQRGDKKRRLNIKCKHIVLIGAYRVTWGVEPHVMSPPDAPSLQHSSRKLLMSITVPFCLMIETYIS